MKWNTPVGTHLKVKSGRLAGSRCTLSAIIDDVDVPAFRVVVTEVSDAAYRRGFRVGDESDLDRHELEVEVQI